MTADLVLKLGMATGYYFAHSTTHRPHVIIAKDTRLSGYIIEPALTAGFASAGMDVTLVGPMPTSAVAMLIRSLRADMGVMITASHNPYQDNGLKLFGPDGYKLSDEVQTKIEELMHNEMKKILVKPRKIGRARRLDDAQARYIECVKSTFPKHLRLNGLKIVLDCANGAAYHVGPAILWELGAKVILLGTKPDGFNINKKCGSTYPKTMIDAVLKHDAHLGIAVDGDADRLTLCDEKGQLIEGDQIMAAIATYWQAGDRLKGDGVVATDMSNMGLEHFLRRKGLKLHRTKVGDRYVVEQMRRTGLNVGGESSGHIMLSDYATTGDGLLAAVQMLALMVESGKPMSKVGHQFVPFPQVVVNVKYTGGAPLKNDKIQSAVDDATASLKKKGRVLVRKSGTQALLRIMVEGENERQISKLAAAIAEAAEAA